MKKETFFKAFTFLIPISLLQFFFSSITTRIIVNQEKRKGWSSYISENVFAGRYGSKNIFSSAILGSNSSEYTWMGNHFIPPKGVPTFQSEDYKLYFQTRNTLFIGDSTGRRTYATLFGIINATDHTNVHVQELDDRNVIDINKQGNLQEHCNNNARNLMLLNGTEFICRDILVDPNLPEQLDKNNDNGFLRQRDLTPSEYSLTLPGKFDFFRINCLRDIELTFSSEILAQMKVFEQYDLIVVSMGIWEAVRAGDCALSSHSNAEKFDRSLRFLANISSPNLQVAFRTTGFHQSHTGDEIMWNLNHHAKTVSAQLAKENIEKMNNRTNFLIVDWGTVVSKRSFGSERIVGDRKVHYGLQARLLFAQQLLHELLVSDK